MRAILTLLATLQLAAAAHSQPRADLDARAYLALAAAQPAAAGVVPRGPGMAYVDAVAWTHLTHRPVMVSVRMDCSALCSTLRPEIPATHVADLAGDGAPHLRLIVADPAGQLWRSGERWTALPSEFEVKAAAANLARHVAPPEAGAHTPTAPAASGAACPGGNCSTGGGLFPLFRR